MGRVLAEAFEGGLTGFRMDFPVVNHLKPGEERFIELRQGLDRRHAQLRQKIGLDKLKETLDLAPALGIVGRAEDTLDTERADKRHPAQMVSSWSEV